MYHWKPLKMAAAVMVVVTLVCVVPLPLQATPCWTVMVYLDGDNNLEPAAIDDLNEMEAVGSTSKVNIVVQFDRHPLYDTSNGDWDNTKRYYVTKDPSGYDNTIVSTEITNMSEINMGHPDELKDFVTWAKTTYPADHYLLVLWDHGSGWKAFPAGAVKAVCQDDTDGDSLTTKEVAAALHDVTCSGDCPLDIVGFDACFMAMLEIDYEILPYAHYRVASEEVEPNDGWDYRRFLDFLVRNPYASPEEVSKEIVETYMNFYGYNGKETQSAVHLNPTGTVVDTLDVFAQHLAGSMEYDLEIQQARLNVEIFGDPDYIDLYNFAELVRTYVPDTGIKKDATALMNAIQAAVVAEGHGSMNPYAHGISIYFPALAGEYATNYENDVLFSGDTYWEEFLKQYYNPSYPLDAVIEAAPDAVNSTETITVVMEVTNNDDHSITGVAPSPLTVVPTGTAYAVLQSGPVPVSANLVAGDSAVYTWQYQAFSGALGGTIAFSGNAHGTDSISGETVFSPLVSSNRVTVHGPNVITNETVPDHNEQMRPVANNRIRSVESDLEMLQEHFSTMEAEGKDTTPCERLLELVEEYLQRAQENFEKGNYIAANYWALQATEALEEAEKCLENL